ncbi:alpha-L-fucosidase [Parapedobacter deserti]|uniref:alpha-L-fucosidase n=1 Tax=Parapedobacter deserti TaxID=1912957 RepID=A0ABV7JFM0_9SPHI
MKIKKLRVYPIYIVLLCSITAGAIAQQTYKPTWESLDSREVPTWFTDAKFGIFVHWGVYSVPAWAPKGKYAEWYWSLLRNDKPDGPFRSFHRQVYGDDYPYELFAPHFTAELFNPADWANLFQRAGAKYVVLTSKHHDGFCLWPAPSSKGWNSVEIGAKRDLLGELSQAVTATGVKMGHYYSLHNWYDKDYAPADPEGGRDIGKYVDEVMMPQLKDLVKRYNPSLLFADGEWTASAEAYKSKEFLAWLYNEPGVPADIVVNDRWGEGTRSKHGGYYTTEYGEVDVNGTPLADRHPWEECRGIGASFGFNRNENIEDYLTRQQIIHLLIDVVSRGGNLLLNVGPTADGRIPAIMEDRLLALGGWLDINGEAIYQTQRWLVEGEGPTPREASIAMAKSAKEAVNYTDKDIRYTLSKDSTALYAMVMGQPHKEVQLQAVRVTGKKSGSITLLGHPGNIAYTVKRDGQLIIKVPDSIQTELTGGHAFVFKLSGFEMHPAIQSSK